MYLTDHTSGKKNVCLVWSRGTATVVLATSILLAGCGGATTPNDSASQGATSVATSASGVGDTGSTAAETAVAESDSAATSGTTGDTDGTTGSATSGTTGDTDGTTGSATSGTTGDSAGGITGDATEDNETVGLTTIGEIARNPETYAGQVVTITGQIDDSARGQRAFLVNDPDLLDVGSIVVLGATEQTFTDANVEDDWFSNDTEVLITGTVQSYVGELGSQYGIGGDEAQNFTEYENQPAIIAEGIMRVVTLSDLSENMSENMTQYQNQMIAVRGLKGESLNSRVFRLSDTGLTEDSNLLVVNTIGASIAGGIDTGQAGGGAASSATSSATSGAGVTTVPTDATSTGAITGGNTTDTNDDMATGDGLFADNQELLVIGMLEPLSASAIEQEYGITIPQGEDSTTGDTGGSDASGTSTTGDTGDTGGTDNAMNQFVLIATSIIPAEAEQ